MLFEITNTMRQKLEDICKKFYVRKLSVFGSTLHGDARPDSDLDVLIEFIPGQVPGLFTFAGLERQLSEVLGRKVDLRTAEDLSRYFRREVVEEAQPIFTDLADAAKETTIVEN